jgi:hypothetical protein
MITKFEGDYDYLNMFHNCSVTFEGRTYLNAYAAYQASKCANENDKRAFTRLNALKAKKRSRTITARDDWDKIKFDIMYKIQEAKFTQNEDLKEKLLKTKGLIVNNTSYPDKDYGVHNGRGKNALGAILMELRDNLLSQERDQTEE